METYWQKRGDTFSLAGTCRLPAGTWTARSQFRSPGSDGVVDELDVALEVHTPVDGADTWTHDLSLFADATATATWPLGELACDVEFTAAGGIVRSTETFKVVVVKDVTRAG
jgi:hypothetical protein